MSKHKMGHHLPICLSNSRLTKPQGRRDIIKFPLGILSNTIGKAPDVYNCDLVAIIYLMKNSGDIHSVPGTKGRMTKARQAIVEILTSAGCPLSATEIGAALRHAGISVDKSTIYRQLEFLERQQVVKSVQFDERRRRYEMAALTHHHHLVCVGCRAVEDITCQQAIVAQEEKILREKNFRVLKHSLEFFGLCARCH